MSAWHIVRYLDADDLPTDEPCFCHIGRNHRAGEQ